MQCILHLVTTETELIENYRPHVSVYACVYLVFLNLWELSLLIGKSVCYELLAMLQVYSSTKYAG